jgi:hypothetical protein
MVVGSINTFLCDSRSRLNRTEGELWMARSGGAETLVLAFGRKGVRKWLNVGGKEKKSLREEEKE